MSARPLNARPWQGFYINLDHRTDRCAGMEAELARTGLGDRYERFTAIEGNALNLQGPLGDGQKGCFASHTLALKKGLGQSRHLHIVEDDVLFGPCTELGLQMAIDKGWLQDYDILFTDTYVPTYREGFAAYKAMFDAAVQRDDHGNIIGINFGVADLRHKAFASMNSYLINSQSIGKLHDLYVTEIARGPQLPVDLFVRKLCDEGVIRVGLLFPFITATRIDDSLNSDLCTPEAKLSLLAGEIARYSFFIGSDWGKCMTYLQKYMPASSPSTDAHAEVLKYILRHFSTEGL